MGAERNMTTIALHRGVMSGDRCVTDGSAQIMQTIKVREIGHGWVMGACGDLMLTELMFEQLAGQIQEVVSCQLGDVSEEIEGMISRDEDGDAAIEWSALLAHATLGSYMLQIMPSGILVAMPLDPSAPIAIGSGSPFALGAMHAGATAHEAVEIACRLDSRSRPPQDTVPLNDAVPDTAH